MARSLIRRRQEAERERIEAYCGTLRGHAARAEPRRPPPDFERALAQAIAGLEGEAVREPASWNPRLKTRDPARLRLAAARHLFARFPVPAALERIWLDMEGLDAAEVRLRKRWYVVAARGGSLFRECAGTLLSRKEVHVFLGASADLGFEEAFWHAVARSHTGDAGVALRIARSKIARTPRGELGFWHEAARFFCANPATLAEIDDLSDYLAQCHRSDRSYSLKGRTLASLRRRMHEWHRDLAAIQRIEQARQRAAARYGIGWHDGEADGASWRGSPLEDWTWQPSGQPSGKEARATREAYLVKQLRTAADLVEETRAMRHCVSTYARYCIAGHASIWSLRRLASGKAERLLTIELDPRNRAVQVRGFANRLPVPDELKVLARWARERGIALP